MDIPSAKSLNRRNIPFYLAGALPAAGNEILLQPRGPGQPLMDSGPHCPVGQRP